MKKTKETGYAVRIGDPKFHHLYFMLTKCGLGVRIFDNAEEAQSHCSKETNRKVVKVVITEQ